MQFVEDTERRAQIIQGIRDRMPERSAGVHLSDLTGCLNKYYYKCLYGERPVEDDLLLLFTSGRAIQAWMTGKFEDAPSVTLDGITCSVDNMENGVHEELKYTYSSSNKPIKQQWLTQIMGYCKAHGVREFVLSQWNVMGDWSWVYKRKDRPVDGRHPVLTSTRMVFTDAEIDENWEWCLRRKQVLEMAEKNRVEPSLIVPDWLGEIDGRWQCKNGSSVCVWYGECVSRC